MSNSSRPVALITGASRGIGRAIAAELADSHHLLIGGRTLQAVQPVVDQLPSAEGFVCDLSDDAALQQACAPMDRLDVLVHSAGASLSGSIADTPLSEWRRVFELNVFAVANLTRLLLPQLRASGGQVVMINSGSGHQARPDAGVYSASKFALRALTDALREEERGQVRVSSVHPGRTDTEMQQELQRHLSRPYDPSEHVRPESIAAAVALAVNTSAEATVEEISIRPVFKA